MTYLWTNRYAINSTHVNGNGGFSDTDHWSSTKFDASNAWNQLFGGGDQNTDAKTSLYQVRCVRAF